MANQIHTFQIENSAGVVFGQYQGATKQDALDAMARDAGYRDYDDACEQSGDDRELIVTQIN